MKHLILTSIFALCLSVTGFAQPFVLAAEGFRSSADESKEYVVVQVAGCDKSTLYQRAKNYFTVTFTSAQDVLSESGVEVISILGKFSNIACRNGKLGGAFCDMSYKLICEFRDDRVRITPICVELVDGISTYHIQARGGLSIGIYRKNGELRDEQCKEQIEKRINPLIIGLEQALKAETFETSEDDW